MKENRNRIVHVVVLLRTCGGRKKRAKKVIISTINVGGVITK